MARQPILFDLKSLYRVKGLAEDFDAVLRALVQDAMARPGVTKKRELKLSIEVTPKDTADDVNVTVRTSSTLPARTALTYNMFTTTNAGLKFNPATPSTPEQTDFLEDEDEG